MDTIAQAILADIRKHENGCWTWEGQSGCNVVELLAEMLGKPIPRKRKTYRMPDCALGSRCVNPEHIGTADQWFSRLRELRRPEFRDLNG